jgi:hypothetical protein
VRVDDCVQQSADEVMERADVFERPQYDEQEILCVPLKQTPRTSNYGSSSWFSTSQLAEEPSTCHETQYRGVDEGFDRFLRIGGELVQAVAALEFLEEELYGPASPVDAGDLLRTQHVGWNVGEVAVEGLRVDVSHRNMAVPGAVATAPPPVLTTLELNPDLHIERLAMQLPQDVFEPVALQSDRGRSDYSVQSDDQRENPPVCDGRK